MCGLGNIGLHGRHAGVGKVSRVLFFSRVTAEPNARGNATYMLDLMRALGEAGFEVELAVLQAPDDPPGAWNARVTEGERAWARQRMAERPAPVVLVNYACLADILDDAPAGTLTAILTHDVCSLRGDSFACAGASQDGLRWAAERESQLLAKARLLVAIQEAEAEALQALAPNARIVLAPFSARPSPLTGPAVPGRCLFVGSDADHNHFNLLWFLDAVWPMVLAGNPAASLDVCGTVNHRIKRCFPSTVMHGRVEELMPHYAAAQLCLVPLRVGSGLEIKLVEALSYGKPCVVSSAALPTLPECCRTAVLSANDANSFAAEMLRGLADPVLREDLGARAMACTEHCFHPRKTYAALVQRLSDHCAGFSRDNPSAAQ